MRKFDTDGGLPATGKTGDDADVNEAIRPRTSYVRTADGVYIGYQVFGDGPIDLVINDGWITNVDANWDLPIFSDVYRQFARRFRCIMFDRRGVGISDRPPTVESMLLERAMDDMGAVMDAAGSERALVWGFEDGCAVSLLFAASRPDRTLGLVLAAPSVAYWRTEDYPWGFSEEDSRHWDERIENAWGTVEFWRENAAGLQAEVSEQVLEHLARWSRLCVSPQAALAIEQVQRQLDVRPLLPEIRVPTLVLQKEGDRAEGRMAGPWIAEQIPGARFVELPGKTHFIVPEDAGHFAEIDRFVAEIREEQAELDRVLATVLFTDIVESTQHAVELGDRAWRELLERHHATVRSILARFRGHEVDTAGDGFFATFDGPARAVRCAQQITGAVRPLGLEIRAGVHTGEVQMIDGKAGGLGVVIGARVGALAGPSEVLVSQTVKDLVAGSGLVFDDRGLQHLKGVPDEWRVYAAG